MTIECVDFVTNCELDLVEIRLKDRQELFVGSFFMPKRNMTDLNNLRQSLELLNKTKLKHLYFYVHISIALTLIGINCA